METPPSSCSDLEAILHSPILQPSGNHTGSTFKYNQNPNLSPALTLTQEVITSHLLTGLRKQDGSSYRDCEKPCKFSIYLRVKAKPLLAKTYTALCHLPSPPTRPRSCNLPCSWTPWLHPLSPPSSSPAYQVCTGLGPLI